MLLFFIIAAIFCAGNGASEFTSQREIIAGMLARGDIADALIAARVSIAGRKLNARNVAEEDDSTGE